MSETAPPCVLHPHLDIAHVDELVDVADAGRDRPVLGRIPRPLRRHQLPDDGPRCASARQSAAAPRSSLRQLLQPGGGSEEGVPPSLWIRLYGSSWSEACSVAFNEFRTSRQRMTTNDNLNKLDVGCWMLDVGAVVAVWLMLRRLDSTARGYELPLRHDPGAAEYLAALKDPRSLVSRQEPT